MFRDAFTGNPVGSALPLEIDLPRMMDKDFARQLDVAAQAVSDTAGAVVIVNGLLQVLLGASLKAIWSVLNTLQFIVFFNEVKAPLSGACVAVLEVLRALALGDFSWLVNLVKE